MNHWPQITLLIMLAMSLGLHLAKHGEPKEGKYNFGWAMVSFVITALLLCAGGFFDGMID